MLLSSTTGLYGINHIIMLLISIALIITSVTLIKKKNLPFEKLVNIMLVIWAISEFIKIINNMEYLLSTGEIVDAFLYKRQEGVTIVRAYLSRTELPFHLCSIQPFFILFYKFSKNEKIKDTILKFMFPTCLGGATCSLLLVTIKCAWTNPQMYEYFFFHAALIVFAITIVMKRLINITFKSHVKTCGMLLLMFISSIWINTILSDTGSNNTKLYTNFFYSNEPPLKNLPILNLNHGWYVYILIVITLGITLLTLIDLPFIIKNKKRGIK